MRQLLIISLLIINIHIFANPTNPQVIKGSVKFVEDQTSLKILSATDKTIINWKDFNIEANEITNFIQPDINSIVLNKIIGDKTSNIFGKLESNGKIFLLNPKGILIGKEAQINVESFFASTLDLKNIDDFENELFFEDSSSSSIVHLGNINAKADVYLISKKIETQGTIKARDVNLVAATKVLIKPKDVDNIFIISEEKPTSKEEIGIDNNAVIEAAKVKLKSDGSLYENAIKHSSKIEATGLKSENGEIYLVAKNGMIKTDKNSKLIAKNSDDTGGKIHILADDVRVEHNTLIDVSADKGKGEVYIGGGYQGKDERFFNSQNTFVSKDTKINADAITNGDGGKVILWSDKDTAFHGNISTQGGEISGNGGFIEISGLRNLAYRGKVNTKALNGQLGTLLLDPSDITISGAATSGGAFDGGSPTNTFTATLATANLDNSDLTTALNSANVVITTTSAFASAGDISFTSMYTFTGGAGSGGLTLNADNDIFVNDNVTLDFNLGSTPDLIFTAGRDIIIGDGTNTTFRVDDANAITMTAGRNFTVQDDATFDINTTQTITLTAVSTFLVNNATAGQPGRILFDTSDTLNITGNDVTILGQVENTATGDINVTSTNDIKIGPSTNTGSSSTNPSYISLNNGTISINSGNDLILTAGDTKAFQSAQIGRKGTAVTCDIELTVERNVSLSAGDDNDCFALIGHGGSQVFADGFMNGDIIIHKIGGNCTIDANGSAAPQPESFALIGCSYADDNEDISLKGDIRGPTVGSYGVINGTLTITAGNDTQRYAGIGHIGSNITATAAGGSILAEGNILIQANDIEISAGEGQDSSAGIGFRARMGASAINPTIIFRNSTVFVKSLGNIFMKAGPGVSDSGAAFIGGFINTGGQAGIDISIDIDMIDIDCGSMLTLLGGVTAPDENIVILGALSANITPSSVIFAGSAKSNLNIFVTGNFSAISRLGETIYIQNGNTTSSGYTMNIESGGDFFMLGEAKGVQVNAIDTATITVGRDLTLMSDEEAIIIDADNTLTVKATDIDIIGHCSSTGTIRATIQNQAGILEVFAQRDITLGPYGQIVNQGSGITNIVVDNAFPTPWARGPGQLQMDAHSDLGRNSGGLLRVFTSSRDQNFIENAFGTTFADAGLNNNRFIPGPLYVDSTTEKWATYYPSSYGGSPYTIFYKNFALPTLEALLGQDPTFLYPDYELFYKPFYIYLYYDPFVRIPKQRKVPWDQVIQATEDLIDKCFQKKGKKKIECFKNKKKI